MTDVFRRGMWHLVLVAMLTRPAATARAQGDARDWPMYNHDVLGSRHNPGETAIGRANAGRLEEKWRFPAEGLGRGDRGHPRHARRRGRLRLLRHGDRPDVLQADARRQGPLVLPQPDPLRAECPRRPRRRPRGRRTTSGSSRSSEGHHRLGPGDRGHRLLRRPRRLVLRPRPGDRHGALEARRAGQGLPRRPPASTSSSPRRSSPTAS